MKFKTYFEVFKVIFFVFIVICLASFGYNALQYVKEYFKFGSDLEHLKYELSMSIQEKIDINNREFKRYLDNQARASTTIVESLNNQIELLKKNNGQLLEDIKKNGEEIKNIGVVQTKLDENLSRKLKEFSDHQYKADTGDYNEQYFKKIMLSAKDKDGKVLEIPVGWAMFFPNREPEKRWKTGIYPLEYYLKIIQSQQKTGQLNTYAEAWVATDKPKEYKGIELPIKIKEMKFDQLKKMNKEFFLWNPRLSLNIDSCFSPVLDTNIMGGLGMSVMGYGRTKNDLDWRFVEFGFSTTGEDFIVKLSPFSYNVGNYLPLISNTFLGPFIGYGNNEVVYGVGIGVPF